MSKEQLEAVTAELDALGIEHTIAHGKHLKMKFAVNGRSRMCVVPVSGSDRLGPRKSRADVRRMLPADGLLA
jgi:hypothetical protein